MKKDLRLVKRTLLWFTVSVLVVVGMLLAAAYFLEDKIERLVVSELNRHLVSEVNVRDIEFSLLHHFPSASLRIKDINAKESWEGSKENFAQIGYLSLLFNPLDLMAGKYRLQKIVVQDAMIRLKVDKDGTPNYRIWKTEADTVSVNDTSGFSIDLEDIDLIRVDLEYADEHARQHIEAFLHNANLDGHFSNTQFDLGASLKSSHFSYGAEGITYVADKDLKLKTVIHVDTDKQRYTIDEAEATLGKAPFVIKGFVQEEPKRTQLDFDIEGKETNIGTLLALMPERYAHYVQHYKSQGQIYFSAALKGYAGNKQSPVFSAKFGVSNAAITNTEHNISLNKANFSGAFNSGEKDGKEFLRIENFSAVLLGKPVKGSFYLQNFTDPYVKSQVEGQLDLAGLKQFAELPSVKELSGLLDLDASLEGRLSALEPGKRGPKPVLKGRAAFTEVRFTTDSGNVEYQNIEGILSSNGQDLTIESFSGKANNSDLSLKGELVSFLPYLFTEEGHLTANARLQSAHLQVEDFLFAAPESESKVSEDSIASFKFPERVTARLSVSIDVLKYDRFSARNLKGQMELENGRASCRQLQLATMGGQATLDGELAGLPSGGFNATGKVYLQRLDVSDLFYQLYDFDQDIVTHQNIKGRMNGDIAFSMRWLPNMEADMNSVNSTAAISIQDGQLIRVAPVMDMGKFLKTDRFDHIYFSTLTNTLSIKSGKLLIPAMDIKSSAFDMRVEGSHSFDNMMDYKVRLNASQIVFGKRSSYESEYGFVQVAETDGIRVHLKITGPADNPDISYDTDAMKEGVKQGVVKEGKQFRETITGETVKEQEEHKKKVKEMNRPREGGLYFEEDE